MGAPESMTPAQKESLQKAWDLLTEHFDRVLLVADWEVEGDLRQSAHVGYWHGGALAAVGMAEFAKDRVLSGGRVQNEEPED